MSTDKKSLTLRGIVAAPDAHGRLRFLLIEKRKDGHYDTSWATLSKEIPTVYGFHMPYSLKEPDEDGIRGEFSVVVAKPRPSKYQLGDRAAYWAKFVAPLRGAEVEVDVRPKKYSFVPAGSGDIEPVTGYTLYLDEVRK
jgi:hypothetical protein